MFCISINHKNTPADVREKFAFTTKGQRQFTENVRDRVGGCVVLSTCNRMEIYFTGEEQTCTDMEGMLADDRGVSVQLVRKYSMNYSGFQSVYHLCRVACGMDSMVLGEVEIIHQVKNAYLLARELGAVDGELNLAFQGALATAKAMASRSGTARLPVSVGTLSAREAVSFCSDHDGISGRILVVGATGKIGSIVVKDIADLAPDIEIVGTSRSHHRTEEIFPRHTHVRLTDYRERYDLVTWADVVISATSSPHYTFVGDEVAAAVAANPKKRLFLDLAMPKDMDPSIGAIEGCILKNIDHIRTLSRENNDSKARTITEMEPWVISKVDEIMKNIALSKFHQEHGDVVDELKKTDGAGFIYRLKDRLDYASFKKVLDGMI